MVSYAAPGGGVGAHVDSYDVFLLQGERPAALAHQPAARSVAQAGIAAQAARELPSRRRLDARPGRHAVPAARPRARGRRRRRLHDLFDRVPRAFDAATRDRLPRLAARRSRARRPLRRSGPAAGARAGAHRRGNAGAVRGDARPHPLGPFRRRRLSRLLSDRAQAERLLRAAGAPFGAAARSLRRLRDAACAWTRARSCYTMPAGSLSTVQRSRGPRAGAPAIERLANARGIARGKPADSRAGQTALSMVLRWLSPP